MRRTLTLILSIAVLSSCGGTNLPFSTSQAASSAVPADATARVPVVGGCQIFPSDNWWNTDISQYPLDPLSSKYIAALPGNLHPDFGHDPHYGIPFNIVPSSQKMPRRQASTAPARSSTHRWSTSSRTSLICT